MRGKWKEGKISFARWRWILRRRRRGSGGRLEDGDARIVDEEGDVRENAETRPLLG